jgi:hypothetical protein
MTEPSDDDLPPGFSYLNSPPGFGWFAPPGATPKNSSGWRSGSNSIWPAKQNSEGCAANDHRPGPRGRLRPVRPLAPGRPMGAPTTADFHDAS